MNKDEHGYGGRQRCLLASIRKLYAKPSFRGNVGNRGEDHLTEASVRRSMSRHRCNDTRKHWFTMSFSTVMKRVRNQQKLSRYKISKISGISQGALHAIEVKSIDLKFSTACKIADALRVPLQTFRGK